MNMRTNLLAALLALLLGCGAMQSAQAQRPTRISGSAHEETWGANASFNWWPLCTLYLTDDMGHTWTAQTNWSTNWWLDNMPTKRWYNVRAHCNAILGGWSGTIRVYVPEQNGFGVPTLICH